MRFFTSKLTGCVLGGAIFCVVALLFTPLVNRSPDGGRRSQCQTNLKQIALAIKQYSADNDEHFPSLRTVEGWRGAVLHYQKNEAVFLCPNVKGDRAPQNADYWFNARLSGVSEASVESIGQTVSLGDGYSTTDPRVALSQLPKSWLADPNSPARRHLDGLNVAFADGHVKWLRPEKVTTQKTRENYVTFSLE